MNKRTSDNSAHTAKGLIHFLGLKKSIVGMLTMVILVGMGERMAERFLPIYLLALGGGTLSVGILNGLQNLLSALYSFPGGYLSDKLGNKRALLVFNCIALFGYGIVIIFANWIAVLIGAIFFLAWSAISLPATMSLVSHVLPSNKRTMGVSVHSFVRRIPMSLGPLAGGALIAAFGEVLGVRLAFGGAAMLGLVSIVVQQKYIEEQPKKTRAEGNPLHLWKHMDRSLKNLLVPDILVRFCEQIPYAFVVIWCMKLHQITAVEFGLLTTVEMVTAMLVYIPVAYLADRGTKKPFVAITFFNFALFPLILLFSTSFPLLVIAFVVRGLKEFGEPTRKALIMDLAPDNMKAGMFGLYYLLRDVIVSVVAFGGFYLWELSPTVNFLTAFGCGLAALIYFLIFGKNTRSAPTPAS
jgi:MFS family permease